MNLTYRELQFLASFGFFGGLWILVSLAVLITTTKINLKENWKKTVNLVVLLLGYASFGLISVFDYLFWWLSFTLFIVYAVGWLLLINHLTHHHNQDLPPGDYELLEETEQPREEGRGRKPLALTNFLITVELRRRDRLKIIFLVFLLASLLVIFWGTSSICIASEPVSISIRFTRLFYDDPCAQTAPCFVYLTVGKNLSSSLTVHFHTGSRYSRPTVLFGLSNGTSYAFEATAQERKMELEVERYVYHVTLHNLMPDTVYSFVAGDIDRSTFSTEKRFRTSPLDDNYTYIIGGDTGDWNVTDKLFAQAAEKSPLFVGLGGDLAYEDGYSTCYARWDSWLSRWQKLMVTPEGYSIPLMAAIGNHEASKFESTRDLTPFYFAYLIQNDESSSYHSHYIGQTNFVVLDSWVISPPDGNQLTWLREQLSKSILNVALYHAPLYPATLDDDFSSSLRAHWEPLFDEYNVRIAYENHAHRYKRTKKLRNGKECSNGTLYIGDGAMGVVARTPIPQWYHEITARERFFLLVQSTTSSSLSVQAINENGTVFDTVTLLH